jgi:hypothetical protein
MEIIESFNISFISIINDSYSVSISNESNFSLLLDFNKTCLIFKWRESRTSLLFPGLFGISLFSVVIVDEQSHFSLSNDLTSSWT